MMFEWMEQNTGVTLAIQDWNTDATPQGMADCIGTESWNNINEDMYGILSYRTTG